MRKATWVAVTTSLVLRYARTAVTTHSTISTPRISATALLLVLLALRPDGRLDGWADRADRHDPGKRCSFGVVVAGAVAGVVDLLKGLLLLLIVLFKELGTTPE